jgi:MFS family permease
MRVPLPPLARNTRFLALWGAETTSILGNALSKLTLILLITEQTHSVGAVAGLTLALALPTLAVGLVAGAYVDRWDRRRTMLASDLPRGSTAAARLLIRAADQHEQPE